MHHELGAVRPGQTVEVLVENGRHPVPPFADARSVPRRSCGRLRVGRDPPGPVLPGENPGGEYLALGRHGVFPGHQDAGPAHDDRSVRAEDAHALRLVEGAGALQLSGETPAMWRCIAARSGWNTPGITTVASSTLVLLAVSK